MKAPLLLVAVLALSFVPAFGQKAFIDYDKAYDHDKIETFAWKKTADTSLEEENPLLHSRIVQGIEHYLSMGGLVEVSEDPDVYVTYHGSVKTDVSVNTSTFGYVYPMTWGFGGYYRHFGYPTMAIGVGVTSNTSIYQKGTLVVDVWDTRSKELVWRGLAVDLKMTEVATTMAKRVDKGLALMVKQWQKIKKKNARDKAQAKR